MRVIISTAIVLMFSITVHGQYTLHKEVNGVQFYTKWGNEKWWSKKSPKVLLIKVKNTNGLAVSYTIGVEFFKNLQLLEASKEEEYCLGQNATAFPRSAGLVFKPTDEAALKEMDTFELSGLEVEKQSEFECPKK